MPVLELRLSEDVYPSQETIPDALRYIDLPRCARTHLSTWNWGATDILPFKPAVALWLTLFFRIGLWIDTLVPKGLRFIKEWIFASVCVRPCWWTPSSCLHCRPYLFASCIHGSDFVSSIISSKIQGGKLRITWSCATLSVCDYTEYGFCEIWEVVERRCLSKHNFSTAGVKVEAVGSPKMWSACCCRASS